MCFKNPCVRIGFNEVVVEEKKVMHFILPEKLFIAKSTTIAEQFNICTRHFRPMMGLPPSITFVLHKNIVEFTGLVVLVFNSSIN